MEAADIIVGSTERLCDISPKPDITFHGPNLIDCSTIEQVYCNRVLNENIKGYEPIRKNKQIVFVAKHENNKPELQKIPDNYDPVRILWTGSSTHEEDLKQIIDPVLYLGKRYGMAIRFIFFGYCPTEFLKVYIEHGNTNQQLVIRDEYSHFIDYIEAVKFPQYYKVLESLCPDFSLCPLSPVVFNLAKSNIKVLELGAMGIPSIVSDYGPYKFIADNQDGLKVQVMNKSGWIQAIELLINSVNDRQRLGSNIRERVFNDFSWNHDSENRRKWDIIFNEIHRLVQIRKDED